MLAWLEDKIYPTNGFCTYDKLTYGIYMAVLLDIVPNVWASHGTTGVHLGESTGDFKPKPQS